MGVSNWVAFEQVRSKSHAGTNICHLFLNKGCFNWLYFLDSTVRTRRVKDYRFSDPRAFKGQYPQPPEQVTKRNTAASPFTETPHFAATLNPGTSSTCAGSPGFKVASPPKQWFVYRLTFATSTNEVLECIKRKIDSLSQLSDVKPRPSDSFFQQSFLLALLE